MSRNDFGLFLVLVLLWGSAYSMMKAGFTYFPPVLYAALMFEVAGVLMIPVLIWNGEGVVPRSGLEWGQIVVGAVFMIAGYHAFLFLGQQYTKTVYAAVVVSSSPIMTAFLAGVILPDRIFSLRELVGLLVSFSGVILLLFGRTAEEAVLEPGIVGVGPLLILVAVVLFDGAAVLMKRIGAEKLSYRFLTWSMLGGGAILHAGSAVVAGERLSDVSLNAYSVLMFSYFTLGPTLAGYLIYYSLIKRMDVVRLNVVSYFTPVCAAIIGYLWLNEVPRWSTLIGFGLVVGGFLVIGPVVHALADSKD